MPSSDERIGELGGAKGAEVVDSFADANQL
jgi:hypothetical protein